MGGIPKEIDTITLDGVVYPLDIPGQAQGSDSPHKMYPQRLIQAEGEGGEFWKEWVMPSFHGGERLERILSDQDLASYRYHDAEGVDVNLLAKWGEMRLASAMTLSLASTGAAMPMVSFIDSGGTAKLVVGTQDPNSGDYHISLWTYSGGWANASAVAGSGAVTDLISVGSTLYGVRGGAVITSTDGGDNWTAVGSYTTAVGVAYVNSELYVGKSDGVYNHTGAEAVSTEGCTCICGYRENIYFASDRRLWRYDGKATYIYDELPAGFTVTALIPYRQILLILGKFSVRTTSRGAVYYIISGSENHLYSIPWIDGEGAISAAAGSDNEIFFANPNRAAADRYDLEAGGISNGPGWWASSGTGVAFKGMAVCEGVLFYAIPNNSIYQADIQSPTAFKTTGWLTTAEWDFGWNNDVKLIGSIYIEHKALLQGESVKVEYSLDHGATYTEAGISAVSGSTSCVFPLIGVKGQTLKLRLTLTGPGTSTPTLTKVVARAAACTDKAWVWDLRLAILIGLGGGREMRDGLVATINKQTALPFTDIDGQKYTVVIEGCNLTVNPGKNQDNNTVLLRLRTV